MKRRELKGLPVDLCFNAKGTFKYFLHYINRIYSGTEKMDLPEAFNENYQRFVIYVDKDFVPVTSQFGFKLDSVGIFDLLDELQVLSILNYKGKIKPVISIAVEVLKTGTATKRGHDIHSSIYSQLENRWPNITIEFLTR